MSKIHAILASTLFQRAMPNGQACIVGVLELDAPLNLDEVAQYPMSFDDKPVLINEPVLVEADRHFASYTVDEKLRAVCWLGVEREQNPSIAFVRLLQLAPDNNAYFVFAALNSPLFEPNHSSGDSWHQFAGHAWATIAPLAPSRGETPLTLTRSVPWPAKGESFYVSGCSEVHVRALNHLATTFLTAFLKGELKEDKDFRQCFNRAKDTAKAAGASPDIIELAGLGHYRDTDYLRYLALRYPSGIVDGSTHEPFDDHERDVERTMASFRDAMTTSPAL